MIIKKFERQDHGDKYKDVLEIITPKGKLARAFAWRKRNTDLSENVSFWRLRSQVMIDHNISEDAYDKFDDWHGLQSRKYNTRTI